MEKTAKKGEQRLSPAESLREIRSRLNSGQITRSERLKLELLASEVREEEVGGVSIDALVNFKRQKKKTH